MPIFVYLCPKCQDEYEIVCKFDDVFLCPVCGEVCDRQITTVGGFDFRGSGWYETDYKKKDKSKLH